MTELLDSINSILWGVPTLILILTVGLILTVCSKFAQFRLLPSAIKLFLRGIRKNNLNKQGISGYRALCTALAATVGTGNIAGVAGAIAIGGPGVVFWMWVCAFLGMIIKMAEVTLAMIYRKKNAIGEYAGGPMHMITIALPPKYHFLAYIYAFFGIVASFGVGNATQVNAVIEGVKSVAESADVTFGVKETLFLGSIIAVLISKAFANGAIGIGRWAEKLIPVASAAYILLAAGVLFLSFSQIPTVIAVIISGAFSPKSITCGAVSSVFLTLRVGTSRGIFTNEAGMGTASIAHASAEGNHPIEQGLMGIVEVFLDTIVICTLTAFVILCSGVEIPYGNDPGILLTMDAFSSVYGNWSRVILTLLSCIFAFATILGWGLYGARCAQFLFGDGVWKYYVLAQVAGVIIGSILNTAVVWVIAEILNALMAIPNLIALYLLTPEFKKVVNSFKKKAHSSE